MIITVKKVGKKSHCELDGKQITLNALDKICRRYLTDDGMSAMWIQLIRNHHCIIQFGEKCDENQILIDKEEELQRERELNGKLQKRLADMRIKAAKYDAIMALSR